MAGGESPDPMRIVELRVSDFKRIKAVTITPDGDDAVIVTGKNAQGKSSLLDAIVAALLGGKAPTTTRPIRDGARRAEIVVDLGDMRVTRVWSGPDRPSTLRVEAADGSRFTQPQTLLDEFVGRMTIDPLRFVTQDDKTRRSMLLDLIDLPFDLDDELAKRQAVYDERTVVNRERDALRVRVDDLPEPDPDTPDTEVSIADTVAEMTAAQAIIDSNRAARALLETRRAETTRLADRLAELREELARTEAAFAEANDQEASAAEAVKKLPPDPDMSVYTARLEEAEATNQRVRAKQARAALARELDAHENQSRELTRMIETIDQRILDAIEAADMPIDGLGVDDGGVTYQGVPFGQCSAAEQLRVSMAIAMAMNPTIRVICIKDGSLLDDDGMALVTEMAREHGHQLWIERVGNGDGGVGFIIEDGELANG